MLPYFLKIKRAIGGSDLYKIYLSESTRKLGLSMIDVFIPIFLIIHYLNENFEIYS